MKKQFTKVLTITLLASLPLLSNDVDYTYKSESLFAIETGYSYYTNDITRELNDLNFGLKVGAQSQNYRIFLNTNRENSVDDKNIYRGGLSLQHLFNFSKYANFFVGINGGITSGGDLNKGTNYPKYYGTDLGFNFYGKNNFDYELGIRAMKTANYGTITAGYFSLVIKYQID